MTNKWISVLGVSVLAFGLSACSDSKVNEEVPYEQHEVKPNESDENESQTSNNESTARDDKDNIENNSEESLNDNDNEESNNEFNNEPEAITALVNKQYSLNETYAPDDLITIDVPTVLENPEVNQLRKVAADALKSMFDTAKKSDVYLHARSGYRSYQTQVQLFKNYTARNGEEAANRYSARPGQSEHQTGLVMDVTSESVDYQLTDRFGDTKEGQWLSEHAHEFGFIIRYPKDKEEITGYIYEPWHIRFLGVDMATKVYESGLTYEEYLEGEGMIHAVNS